jgi:hypothetical protein
MLQQALWQQTAATAQAVAARTRRCHLGKLQHTASYRPDFYTLLGLEPPTITTTTTTTAAAATDAASNDTATAAAAEASVATGVSDVNGDSAMDVDVQPAAAVVTSSTSTSMGSSSCPFAVVRSAVYAAPFGPPSVPLNRKQRRMLAGITGVQQGGSADTAIALTAAAGAAADAVMSGAQHEMQYHEHVLAVTPLPQLAMPTLLPVRILMTRVCSASIYAVRCYSKKYQCTVCGTAALYQLCNATSYTTRSSTLEYECVCCRSAFTY